MMFRIVSGIKRIALVAGVVALAGCGFQLAGSGNLPTGMQATWLDSTEPRSDFSSSLRDEFRRRGYDLVDSSADASARLIVTNDLSDQNVLSVNARNVAREYEVYYTVTFALEVEGQSLIEPEYLVARRNYTYDETEVLGKEREEAQLKRALAEDLARQVMRRIEAAAARRGRTAG